MSIDGKVAIVTGASSGLGVRFAQVLHAAGARVVLAARRVEKLEELASSLDGSVPVACDISDDAQIAALVDRAVSEFGRLDILVTNAGVLRDKVLWKMTDDDFDTVVDTHLRGTFTCARASSSAHVRAKATMPALAAA